jgi:hypothetical protein
MADHQEREESNALRDKSSGSSAALSKGDQARLKLKLIARYAMLGITPVVAVIALVVAVMAVTGNRSGQEQLSQTLAKIDSLNASLSVSKGELELLKASVAKEKAMQNAELAKLDERVMTIVQNITPMQVKLRISPTLDQQLNQPAGASAVVPATPAAPHVSVPAKSHVLAPPASPHVVAPVAPHAVTSTIAVPAKSTAPASADKKLSPQVKAMKDAIEQYNKK